MAKNKKKNKKEVEKKYGNGIAPISLGNNFNLETKKNTTKNTKTTKKEVKKENKQVEETKTNKVTPVEVKADDRFTIKMPEGKQRTAEEQAAFDKKQKEAAKSTGRTAKYVAKKTGLGTTQALTGLVDAPLQNYQEGIERANKKSTLENIKDLYLKKIMPGSFRNVKDTVEDSMNIINDPNKSGWQKAMNVAMEVSSSQGILKDIENIGQSYAVVKSILGQDALGEVKKTREVVNKPAEKFNEYVEKDRDKVGKTGQILGDTGQVVGNMLPSIAATILTGGGGGSAAAQQAASLTTMGVSAKGQATREAEKQGADISTANNIGFVKGLTEVLTEQMYGGVGKLFGKGALDDIAQKGLDRIIKNKGLNYVAKKGADILFEWGEETISDIVDTAVDKATIDPEASYSFDKWKETGLMTALSTMMLNLITGGYAPNTYIENSTQLEKNNQSKNAQKIIETELEERLNNEYNGKATAREIADLQKEVIEDIKNGYISTDTIEKTLGGKTYTKLDNINQERAKIQSEINDLQLKADKNQLSSLEEKQKLADLKEQIKGIDDTEIRNQLNQEIQETIKNDIGLQESYNEVGRRSQDFKVDLNTIEDEKQKTVYQKAMDSGVLNNSNKTHALVDMIAKISSDKGINFDFTNNEQLENSGFGVNGRNINGYVTDSGITINLNSKKAVNRIVGHELTHTFEGTTLYTELQDSLKDFLGSEWDNQLNKYKELYKGVKNANIENELTSDLIGDYLFTDENYVKNLSTKNKNLFEKVYDEIKYLYNVATAGSKERRMLEKVKRTFDRIYNETESKTTAEEKYSLIGEKGIENLKLNDKEAAENLNKSLDYAKQLQNKNVSNKVIWQTTGWYQDKNGRWKYDLSDKAMSINPNIEIKKNGKYKLGDLIEHDNLFKLYPDLKNMPVNFQKFLKKNVYGAYSPSGDYISLNNKKIGNTKTIEKALIHEIQHAIQTREGFEPGANDILSSLSYYNSLGEIEAKDTENRFEKEKYKNYNLDNIEPLSTDPNAKHPDLNRYLQKRGIIDKIRDDIYEKRVKKNNSMDQNSPKENKSKNRNSMESRIEGVDNTSFSLSQDSQGRQLNENQKEYFKNSKVVDDNGNLKVMYNGGGDYTTFDNTKMSDQSKWGKGIYLTEDSNIANMYGDNVKEVYVDIENPINQTEKTISFDKYNKLMQELYDEEADRYDYDMYENDLDLLWDATNKGNWADYGEQLRNIVGVDGLIIEDSNPAERMAIAFNSNQIKNVSNENPTSNADIRYDLSVKEANTTTDNNGRRLSKEQKQYFKDSKAVDNDGNLITVYHTTTNAIEQFNEFNPVGTDYYRFGDQVVNYYTDSKDMSGSYAGQDYVMADTKKITSMDEVNNLLEEHNNNINPEEKYDYNLEIVKDGDGYKLKVTSQPGAAYSGVIEEFYPRKYKNETDLFKRIKNDIKNYRTIRDENGRALSINKKLQYEGYVNITNPYIVDAEERNWNQVISKSNDFIDELDERVSQETKDKLTRLYQESANISSEAREKYNGLQDVIGHIGFNGSIDENIKKVNEVVRRVGYNEIEEVLNDTPMGVMGVRGWYNLAEALESEGLIGESTAELIRDDFILPQEVKEKLQKYYNEPMDRTSFYLDLEGFEKSFNKQKTATLKQIHEQNQKNYLEFDKYRMPNNYFMEQISAENSDYLSPEFEDMLETRVEMKGADAVAEEIAQASSVAFSKPELIRLWGTSKTTNDIVKEIIASNKDGSTNYDGVIIKNVYDYGGHTDVEKSANDLYVTFNSNQFKAVDNTNPTVDPDIRYSLDIAPISKNFLTEAEQEELDGLRNIENSGWTELTPEENSRMLELENKSNTILNKKAEKMLRSASYKAINTSTKIAENYLDFDAKEKKTFRNELRQFSNMTKDELISADTYNKVRDLVNDYANKEINYVDDNIENIKKELKHTKIKISDELKDQITDYGYFVKDSKLMLRRNSGQSVDTVYQEYSDMYPGFFSKDLLASADQLKALNDFINADFTITEKYRIPDSDLKNATDIIYNKLLDNSLSMEDLVETEKILDAKAQRRTRSVVREELLQKMGITPETIQEGNDISAIGFARTDPIRVNEKVFGWKTGQQINDATVNFTKHQEAERIRFLNQERQEIKDLGIKARSKESELVQKYGEKQYIDKNNEVYKYGDEELARDVKDPATREKIKNAARVLREKYDTYIDKANAVLTEMGYDEIPKRQDYMRHFIELDDKFSRWGLPFNKESMSAEDLPTDINGLTEFNRPGKSYFASANTRTGLQTTYDAITGIDGYLEGVSNLIYHTESIQRYRALTRLIRENYGREHGFDNIDLMTDEELADRIKDIQDNKLSKYVAWLDEQANSIAGKKGALDRSVERMFGRRIYTALNTLKSQVGSNMTGFNVRSAMTNFASAIQGMSKTQKLAFAKGTISTINNIIHNDGLIDKSDFLTRRLNASESLAMKPWQKLTQAGQVFMNGTDYFTANQIWRSKYFENLDKGMSETQAIKNADDFAARIMGDRSKGSTAELFNSKTLGFLSQFQLEVNNQWSSLMHDNKIDIQKGNKTPLGVTFELGQLFAASYLFNTMMKSLTGSDVMIDPIDMLKKIFNPDDDDKDKSIVERAQKVLGEFINQLPFANLVTGGGRIPISEAFTGVKTLGTKLMGGTDNYGNEISWGDVKDDMLGSAAYWVLPTGYGQIRKTTKGLSMYDDKLPIAGSYTDSGNLRFSAEDTPFGKVKAGLFGQYSSKYAQDYINSGYKSINASKLDEMQDLDMNSTEYREYRQGLSEAGTSVQEKLNYISSLDVSDDDKSIMASNVAKKDIDMSEYKKYGSYEEFNYAQKNPAKYQMMKYVGGYNAYKNYEKAISEIKSDYDRNGKAISNSRKNKVIQYVNSLNLTKTQKAMLIKEQYPSFTKYDSDIASYINGQNIRYIEKASILKHLGFTAYDKQIINYIRQNYRTVEEQQKELEKLGFKVYNYNGNTYVR